MSKTYQRKKRKQPPKGFDKNQWKRLNDTKIYDSVEWDQYDMVQDLNIIPDAEWRKIDSKKVQRHLFKLQKLIFKASSRGEYKNAVIQDASDKELLREVASC